MESDVTVSQQQGQQPAKKTRECALEQEIFCWGSQNNGQLGLSRPLTQDGEDLHEVLKPTRLTSFQCRRVRDIACGEKHSLVLLNDGTLCSFGNNDRGQLGRDGEGHDLRLIQTLSTHIIVQVTCGQYFCVVVTDLGQLFSWGDNTSGQLGCGFSDNPYIKSPKLVKGLDEMNIVQVACGYEHCLALTDDCQLLTWGSNKHGQMGLGQDVGSMDTPKRITSLHGLPIRQIAAGAHHSATLTISSALFMWGKNSSGQLGIGTTESCLHPKLVKTLRSHRVKHICCGEEHTVALTKDGGVFTWGAGKYGQLGHGSLQEETQPRKVFEVMGSTVTQIACGRRHTLVYIASSGRLYSFGLGATGQLGLGDCNKHSSPMPIPGPFVPYPRPMGDSDKKQSGTTDEIQQGLAQTAVDSKAMEKVDKFVIKRVYTGGDHCFVLVTPLEMPRPPDDMRKADARRRILSVDEKILREYSSFLRGQRPSPAVLGGVDKMFSSMACLNASFLNHNDHFNCSAKHHGVDLDVAKDYFARIAQLPNEHISSIVLAALEKQLPLMHREPHPDVEALRVFLTLPFHQAFQSPSNFRTIIVPFSRALISLKPNPRKVIEKWWEISPADYFEYLVEVYKRVVVHMLYLPNPAGIQEEMLRNESLKTCLDVLERLNSVNMRCPSRIVAYDKFCIHELKDKVDIQKDYLLWLQATKSKENHMSFCHYPFVFDGPAKTVLLQTDAFIQMQSAMNDVLRHNIMGLFLQAPGIDQVNPCLVLYVNRGSIVRDTINQLLLKPPADLKKPLKVKFHGEEAQDAGGVRKVIFLGEDAVDEGGVRKEFFMLLLREVLDPKFGMFRYYEESRLLWFNSATFEDPGQFSLLGQVCGLAIYNSTIISLSFPLTLYKKLLNEPVTLDDMKELQPAVGKSLEELLKYDQDDLEDVFCLTFEISKEVFGHTEQEPLIEGGADIPVTKDNRKEYVDAYIDYVFNTSVHIQFQAFYDGFHKVCGGRVLELFHSEELQEMVIGNESYDWKKFEEIAQYKGEYSATHPTIKMFWEVFHDLSHDDKKNFLSFLTGSDRIPIHGMSSIKLYIQPVKGGEDFLPVAHTCFNLLDLPVYKTKEKLKEKLLLAVAHKEGFGLV